MAWVYNKTFDLVSLPKAVAQLSWTCWLLLSHGLTHVIVNFYVGIAFLRGHVNVPGKLADKKGTANQQNPPDPLIISSELFDTNDINYLK